MGAALRALSSQWLRLATPAFQTNAYHRQWVLSPRTRMIIPVQWVYIHPWIWGTVSFPDTLVAVTCNSRECVRTPRWDEKFFLGATLPDSRTDPYGVWLIHECRWMEKPSSITEKLGARPDSIWISNGDDQGAISRWHRSTPTMLTIDSRMWLTNFERVVQSLLNTWRLLVFVLRFTPDMHQSDQCKLDLLTLLNLRMRIGKLEMFWFFRFVFKTWNNIVSSPEWQKKKNTRTQKKQGEERLCRILALEPNNPKHNLKKRDKTPKHDQLSQHQRKQHDGPRNLSSDTK